MTFFQTLQKTDWTRHAIHWCTAQLVLRLCKCNKLSKSVNYNSSWKSVRLKHDKGAFGVCVAWVVGLPAFVQAEVWCQHCFLFCYLLFLCFHGTCLFDLMTQRQLPCYFQGRSCSAGIWSSHWCGCAQWLTSSPTWPEGGRGVTWPPAGARHCLRLLDMFGWCCSRLNAI